MRWLASACLLASSLSAGSPGWQAALDAAGYHAASVTILEGEAGARDTGRRITVRSVVDTHDPSLEIIWEQPRSVPVFELPAQARVFARDRQSGAPLVACWMEGARAVLWAALPPGDRGFERFPFLPHGLRELGLLPALEARNLWVFFDSSYRLRADLDYLAKRWRAGGVAAIHVAAWHYWEADPQRDAWLSRLIETCHRHAILVYAWVEFPHVSEQFWRDHPEWREKTASGQDAHLDWRQLMDLTSPDCDRAVRAGLRSLMARFDWDGLNLGELYFESLEGASNPARFTPFAPHARAELARETGFDPVSALTNPKRLPALLEARAALAARLQGRWLNALREERALKPHLDLVLTHIDDRFDPSMRDKLGADTTRLLPLAAQAGATFLVEDPATVWHLGPERYAEIARRYSRDSPTSHRLAIDLNIVERYQDVYPTKQQTGVELLQLVRTASRSFPRVALYFENSISRADWPFLAASSAHGDVQRTGATLRVSLPQPGFARFPGCASIDGREWPVRDGERVLLPAGEHTLTGCAESDPLLLADLNGTLLRAERSAPGRIQLTYESGTRAIAVLIQGADRRTVLLAPGRHTVQLSMQD